MPSKGRFFSLLYVAHVTRYVSHVHVDHLVLWRQQKVALMDLR